MTKKKPEQKKDYKWVLLISSITIIFLGIFTLLATPFIHYIWKIQPAELSVYKVTLPSGYVIIGVGLFLELIAFLPEITAVIKGIKKK